MSSEESHPAHFPVNIEDEMRKSYLEYAMSVIVSRALQKVASVYDFSPLLTMSVPILLLGIGAVLVLRRSV